MIEHEQKRFDPISSTLEQEQFYSVRDILCSKSFLKSFALDSGKTMSSGGDNAEDKSMSDVDHVAFDEGEPKKGATSMGEKGIHIGEKHSRDKTPYSLVYRTESVISVEIGMPSFRMMNFDKENNEAELRLNLDFLAKRRSVPGCTKLPTSIGSPSIIARGLNASHFYLTT
ncbi:hypothetical protein Acr_04g0002110 [Actinidia rufa]|uniref:Uncharacterized protein n=1 Tax=Actinidia rufa TaxID=165716 RepID=A0A7J0EG80_9ERIC|nr:hypothetical protein Acr_04g0002110 [Actinidia rufa]